MAVALIAASVALAFAMRHADGAWLPATRTAAIVLLLLLARGAALYASPDEGHTIDRGAYLLMLETTASAALAIAAVILLRALRRPRDQQRSNGPVSAATQAAPADHEGARSYPVTRSGSIHSHHAVCSFKTSSLTPGAHPKHLHSDATATVETRVRFAGSSPQSAARDSLGT